jgi:DNA-binding YbaB/EbfC family protein
MAKMNKFLKQARDMQKKMADLQEELSDSLIEVEASGGAIVIEIAGDQVLHTIKIDPDIIDKDDVDGLEDLILTAVNLALQESKKFSDAKTNDITGGLELPGGLGLS